MAVMTEPSAIASIIGEDLYDEIENEGVELGVQPQEGQVYTHEEYLALMNAEKVTVYVTDPSDPEAEMHWVGYQGMGFNIKCHEWVALPKPLAELLENNQAGMRTAKKKQRALIRTMDPRLAKNWRAAV